MTAPGGLVEGRLGSAHDLAALLAALQLREKDQKDQKVHCEASARGLKFIAQSTAKDVVVLGWMQHDAFREYRFEGQAEELHLKLPVAPLLSCLQIFSDRAALVLQYPSGPSNELRLTLEEDGAVTECQLRTFVLEEAPAPLSMFFAPGDPQTVFRPKQPEVWHMALSEFAELDAPDVVLRVTLRATEQASAPAVILRAQTLTSDAEVELPRSALEDLEISATGPRPGEVTHLYLLSSVLASCLRAARDAKAVKVRFNSEGVMSNQFILRGRNQRDLFCEAIASPLAEAGRVGQLDGRGGLGNAASMGASPYGGLGVPGASQSIPGMESVGF